MCNPLYISVFDENDQKFQKYILVKKLQSERKLKKEKRHVGQHFQKTMMSSTSSKTITHLVHRLLHHDSVDGQWRIIRAQHNLYATEIEVAKIKLYIPI